ncbi:MAG: acyltransferase [Bacteroidetes bacterium]|nr:acyltransferase [Bacteroidota bacterium]
MPIFQTLQKKINEHFFYKDKNTNHVKVLDGLRGLAILIVLLAHSSNAQLFFHEHLNFQKTGKIGVYLFFVLSSYLLDKQIIKAYRDNKISGKYWWNYVLRRLLRIYPLFIISLLIYFALFNLGMTKTNWNLNHVLKHLLLIEGRSFYWSIAMEMKYYLISPLLLLMIHKYLKWDARLSFMFLTLLIASSIMATFSFPAIKFSIIGYLPIFLTGTLMAYFEIIMSNSFEKLINHKAFAKAGIISLTIIIITIPYYFTIITGYTIDLRTVYFYFPFAILFAIIIFSTMGKSTLMRRIFEWKILRFFGVISFSLYIFHMLVLRLSMEINIIENMKIYLFFILTILFSSFSYLIIEKPLSKINLLKRSQ